MSTVACTYAAYVRVSKTGSRDPDDLRSPEIQRKAIAAYAQREGLNVEWLDAEINVSGAKADRKVLEHAIERIESGELGGLIVYRLDRLSRLAPRQRAELFERIEGAGGAVLSTSEVLDPSTPSGRFTRDVFLGVARMQWEERQEGFAEDVKTAVLENGCHAHPPFGYAKPTRDDGEIAKGRPLVVVHAEVPVVRGLFERRAKGTSWSELARWADTTGIKPRRGGHWTRRGVENIVRNRAYLGEARYGKHVRAGAHPAIVTLDVFEAANAARGIRPPRGEAALLSGLVRCAGCRHRLHAATVGDRGQRVYRCRRHHGSGTCEAPVGVTRHLLDELVTAAFLERYGDVELEGREGGDLADAARAYEIAKAELTNYVETNLIEIMGAEAFTAGALVRQARVDEAREALHRSRSSAAGLDLGPDGAAIWPELTITERRRLLNAGIDCVFVRSAPVNGRNRLDADRVKVCWRGEAPDGLPGPGLRAELAPLDW